MLLTKRHGAIFFDKFKTVINDVSGFWIQSLSKVDSESEIAKCRSFLLIVSYTFAVGNSW